jgi:adenylosuccinate synthase
MNAAVVTVGLGFGDEGKGATVDFLCRRLGADLVVRYCGGAQAAHNVVLPDGRRHVFAQFGAGTLAGVPTYIGPQVVINPTALVREADHLKRLGVADPFATLTVHPDAPVSTFFHQSLNRLRERARGDRPHGSCGQGIGEARHDWLRHGSDAVRARDLEDGPRLRRKLELLRQRTLLELQGLARSVADHGETADLLNVGSEAVAERLLEIGRWVRFADEVPHCELAVFEGAQGVLLDEWYGFHPHTTWSTVTAHHALELALQAKAGRVFTMGVTRAFTTRHGAGPLPTYDPELTTRLTDTGNPRNPWQGDLRVGWLDLALLRYAVAAAGPLDGLAVTWLDHAERCKVSTGYQDVTGFTPPAFPDLEWQEGLNRVLESAEPVYREITRRDLLETLAEVAPIAIEAYGPTFRDRELRASSLPDWAADARRPAVGDLTSAVGASTVVNTG